MAKNSGLDAPRPEATAGMGGQGFYDHHSEAQAEATKCQEVRLRNAVSHLKLSGPELRIMDYGCGPGRNSITAFRTILDALRKRDNELPVVAVHNDQIGNDWNVLCSNVGGPHGYLNDANDIRVEASIGSFFGHIASADTVDLGICFAASHWLSSAVSIDSPGSLFFCDLPQPAREAVAAMAVRDWSNFLRCRADELKPGGWLIVDGLSSFPDPEDPSGLCAAGRGLYRAFWKVAASLSAEGTIDSSLLEDFVFPVYFRLSEEIRAPLENDPDLKRIFEVVELTNDRLPSPYEVSLQKTGDAAAYASSYAAFARAFAESTLRDGLFAGSTTSAAAADDLINEYFRRLEDLFRSEPGRHPFEHQVATLVLRKR